MTTATAPNTVLPRIAVPPLHIALAVILCVAAIAICAPGS